MSFPFLQPYFGLGSGLQTKNAAGGGGGGIGGWVELARTTLGSASSTIDVTSLPNKRYYMILYNSVGRSADSSSPGMRFNSDSGSTYAWRGSRNGGVDATGGSNTYLASSYTQDSSDQLQVSYIANYSTKEKLSITHAIQQNTAGAANAPHRSENVSKWANTSNSISTISAYTGSADTFGANSQVIVLGWDPADTHTTNFWTELASTTLSSTASTINSGTFTAKKYLWIQVFQKSTVNGQNTFILFNGDTGATGASRNYSPVDGEVTVTSRTEGGFIAHTASTEGAGNRFFNIFVVNVSNKEKLGIHHVIFSQSAGAGNAPGRGEGVFKWANTSNQITSLSITGGTNQFGSGSILKVWGSD